MHARCTTTSSPLALLAIPLTSMAHVYCAACCPAPSPLSYTRHTVRFLVLWLTALPFCCWHELGWATVPVATVLSFLLLGIEEIGVQIEEPMGILALEVR